MDTAPPTVKMDITQEIGKIIDLKMLFEYYPLESYTAPVQKQDLSTLRFYEPFPMSLQYPMRFFSLPSIPLYAKNGFKKRMSR